MAGISDRLKKAAVKTSSKSSEKPTLLGQEELVDKVMIMKNALEDMNRQYDQVEGELLDKTFELYGQVRKDGNYSSSILVPGKKTNGGMVVYSDKFSNFPVEMEAELQAKDANYAKHFVEVRKLTVKRDAGKTISDKVIDKIINALGEDFEKIFDVKVEIGTQKGLAEMWEELPTSVQEMLKQSKASVRNITTDGKVI